MDMTGEYRIPAPRQRVWEALNDPDILKAAIPGCEDLKKVSDDELEARVRAKVGPVSATFTGKVRLSNLNPPESYTISGEGKGGAAGFARGGAEVRLAEDGADTTVLTYNAKADVGGKLAQIGSRLIQGTAKKMADDFFGRFSAIVGERHAAAAPPPPPPEVAPAPAPVPQAAPSPEPPLAPAVPPVAPAATPGASAAPAAPPGAEATAPGAAPAAPPPPRQVAFGPERERPVAPTTPPPAPAQGGLMQRWWVWLLAAIVLVVLIFALLGRG